MGKITATNQDMIKSDRQHIIRDKKKKKKKKKEKENHDNS
jgi:hypothetical protein